MRPLLASINTILASGEGTIGSDNGQSAGASRAHWLRDQRYLGGTDSASKARWPADRVHDGSTPSNRRMLPLRRICCVRATTSKGIGDESPVSPE